MESESNVLTYGLICIVVTLVLALASVSVSSLMCRGSQNKSRFYLIFSIADAVIGVIMGIIAFLCLNSSEDFAIGLIGGLILLYVVPSSIVLLIVGLITFGVKKHGENKADRILKKAEEQIENILKKQRDVGEVDPSCKPDGQND